MTLSNQDHVDFRLLYLAQEGRCFYCDRPMNPEPATGSRATGRGWTKDHFYPKSAGNGLVRNVVMACLRCNGIKGSINPTAEQQSSFDALSAKYVALLATNHTHHERSADARQKG